jgi:hypothetical protein
MPVSYLVLNEPSVEPLSLADAKTFMRVDFDDEDTLIAQLIVDARREAEKIQKRALSTQTIQATIEPDPMPTGSLSGPVGVPFDSWRLAERPDVPLFGNALVGLKMPMTPVQTLTTVEYQLTKMDVPEWTELTALDDEGNANYRLDQNVDPNKLNIFTILAATRYRLTYVAGYTASQFLPGNTLTLLKRLVSHWYNNREDAEVPQNIIDAFARYRVWEL